MKNQNLGVIVARFQVPKLHEGHKYLLDFVTKKHFKTVVILGVPIREEADFKNPLPFEARRQMVLEEYPEVVVLPLKDNRSDTIWSIELDNLISQLLLPGQTAILYGGENSFTESYEGKFKTVKIPQITYISGTEIRNQIRKETDFNYSFRCGIIWKTTNSHPRVIPAVDIGIVNFENDQVLLARKYEEAQYRFVGGYAIPGLTYKQSAVKVLHKKVGNIDYFNLKLVGDFVIDDLGLKNSGNFITTSFFIVEYKSGLPDPGGNYYELKWFDIKEFELKNLIQEHHILFAQLASELATRKETGICGIK